MTNQIAQPFGNVQDQESYHLEQLRAISARVLAAKEDEFGEDFSTFVGHLKALRVSQCRDELAQLVSEVPYHELNALVPVMEQCSEKAERLGQKVADRLALAQIYRVISHAEISVDGSRISARTRATHVEEEAIGSLENVSVFKLPEHLRDLTAVVPKLLDESHDWDRHTP